MPAELKEDFWELYEPILEADPLGCGGFPNHNLTGDLRGCRALEIEWEGDPNAYRLVYRNL